MNPLENVCDAMEQPKEKDEMMVQAHTERKKSKEKNKLMKFT